MACDHSFCVSVSPFSSNSLYYSAVLMFSILGIFYDGYFYCFHLFHVIIGNETLLRAIRVCQLLLCLRK